MFDSSGERLTPTHARKGNLRYRYYVSHTLVLGRPRADVASKRWRIPAVELECAVLGALISFLDNRSELSSIFRLGRLVPVKAAEVLREATALSMSLSGDDLAQLRKAMQTYVTRVEIADTTIAITLNLTALHDAVRLPALKTDELACHTIIAPVRVTKRGVEQRLVIGGDVITSVQRDETLVKASPVPTRGSRTFGLGASATFRNSPRAKSFHGHTCRRTCRSPSSRRGSCKGSSQVNSRPI